MKRFHIHTTVADLPKSTAFYSQLFATEPARVKGDYAKWLLDDPRVNFAISTRGSRVGVDHLGIQTETEEALSELRARAVAQADGQGGQGAGAGPAEGGRPAGACCAGGQRAGQNSTQACC